MSAAPPSRRRFVAPLKLCRLMRQHFGCDTFSFASEYTPSVCVPLQCNAIPMSRGSVTNVNCDKSLLLLHPNNKEGGQMSGRRGGAGAFGAQVKPVQRPNYVGIANVVDKLPDETRERAFQTMLCAELVLQNDENRMAELDKLLTTMPKEVAAQVRPVMEEKCGVTNRSSSADPVQPQ